nr:hypothetical protein [Nanoarchaeota archaeon]
MKEAHIIIPYYKKGLVDKIRSILTKNGFNVTWTHSKVKDFIEELSAIKKPDVVVFYTLYGFRVDQLKNVCSEENIETIDFSEHNEAQLDKTLKNYLKKNPPRRWKTYPMR